MAFYFRGLLAWEFQQKWRQAFDKTLPHSNDGLSVSLLNSGSPNLINLVTGFTLFSLAVNDPVL